MELYYVMAVVDRDKSKSMVEIYKELRLSVILEAFGKGTATSEHLLLFDLQQTQKTVISTVASRKSLKLLISAAQERMYLDIPGNGILLAIPIKSVSGGKTLEYFTKNQELGGSNPMLEFRNEMIIVILNEGYSDLVMDAARAAGASGGTVIHTKGTGKEHVKKFYGVTIAEEKDMIYILAASDKKSAIMKAINQTCGSGTPSGAISFSLPVSEVVGIRRFEQEQADSSK